MGKAEGGGSGWVIMAYSPRDKRLINQWAADHTTTLAGGRPVMCSRYGTSTPITWIMARPPRIRGCFHEAIRWDNAVKLYDRYRPRS